MPRKKKKPDTTLSTRPSFHEGLEGFDIKVNSFGQMESSFEIDKLNDFLNEQKLKAEAEAKAKEKRGEGEV